LPHRRIAASVSLHPDPSSEHFIPASGVSCSIPTTTLQPPNLYQTSPQWTDFIKVGLPRALAPRSIITSNPSKVSIPPPHYAADLSHLLVNPFAKRDSHNAQSILWYKIFTIVSWLLVVIATFYYNYNAPQDDVYARRSIWQQNDYYYKTGFSLNSVITSIYW
jgi:hypothetical protein